MAIRSVEAVEATWRAQGLRVERDGVLAVRCRGEVVEIPCELVGRAADGSACICVAGRLTRFEREEVADVAGRVMALGDAAPVAEVVAHWIGAGRVTVRAGDALPGVPVDELEVAEGALRRTERGRELVRQAEAAGWPEAIGAVGVAE